MANNANLSRTRNAGASACAHSDVPSSATSVQILAANTSRIGFSVYNDSTQVLKLRFGTDSASSTNFEIPMAPATYYENPFGYTGAVQGIWASANGNARVGEYT